MAPKIFITGGTGYIGGTVLDTLVKQHPEYEVTALLRNPPAKFAELYPNVKVVRGDYDSADTIFEAASKADLVVHNGNSDHVPSLRAILDGLLNSGTTEKPGFLIHLSGTGLIADWRDPTYHGKLNPKIWSDVEDISAITSRDEAELHRITDAMIQDAARQNRDRLKTAIMCPPDIYGAGRGPGKTQSVYFPVFWDEIQKVGGAFYGGEGENVRSWVHIEDLMTVYLKLIEAAVAGGGKADWGVEGYYFAASQEASQIDIAKKTGEILKKHGLLDSAEPKQVSLEYIDTNTMQSWGYPHIGTYMFAANSRSRTDRASKKFGYNPTAPSLWNSLERDLLASVKKQERVPKS